MFLTKESDKIFVNLVEENSLHLIGLNDRLDLRDFFSYCVYVVLFYCRSIHIVIIVTGQGNNSSGDLIEKEHKTIISKRF